MSNGAETLVETLRRRREDGRASRLTFLSPAAPPFEITLDSLVAQAVAQATAYRNAGLRPGDRLVLMLRSDFDFVRMLLGAIVGGMVPVPLYSPTSLKRIQHYLGNLSSILRAASPAALVVLSEVRDVLEIVRGQIPGGARIFGLDELEPLSEEGDELADVTPDTPALIQFSSGSTGTPKGSLISHGNFVANLRAIASRSGDNPSDVCCSWLPLFHDMGLMALLRPLHFNYGFVLMEPETFLRRPARWLRAISDHRATITGCPNFAFDLCVRKVPDGELTGVDLSQWRMACNGAEPIRVDVTEAFIRRFSRWGFRREAMYPCYGLSEFTLAATLPEAGKIVLGQSFSRRALEEEEKAMPVSAGTVAEQDVVVLAGLGSPPPQHDLRIVEVGSGRVLPDGEMGEVVLTGPSLSQGYVSDVERTAKAFGPWVQGHPGRWFRTGDAGFVYRGQLYVTGRLDDLMIVRGRNVHPGDIEAIAERVAGVRGGCTAAVQLSVPPRLGRIVLVAESRKDAAAADIAADIRRHVYSGLGVQIDEVVLIPPGTIPKTSSGKICRKATRVAVQERNLPTRRRPDWVRSALLKARITLSRVRNRLRFMFCEPCGADRSVGPDRR